MNRIDLAKKAGKRIHLAFGLSPLDLATPTQINEAVDALDAWQPGAYAGGEVRTYNGIPYKCVKAHDSGPNPQWTPEAQADLWFEYHGTSTETARPYKQPLGAHDAYQPGEYAIEGGATYRCKVSATVHPPSTLPGSWERVGGSVVPDEPEPPVIDVWPAWAPWDGNNEHLHKVGDQVTHNGSRWVSTANNNHWEPGVYGWSKQP